MSSRSKHEPDHVESASLYALQALPASEISAFEAHLSTCSECLEKIEALRPIINCFVSWPTDVLRPSTSLWERLSRRIGPESGVEPVSSPPRPQEKPEWEEVTAGVFWKVLSIDPVRNRVTMVVRLAPGTQIPPHRHGEMEELHMLDGDLWIDGKKLRAGDFMRSEAGSVDNRVWTETGCTGVLLTSLKNTNLE